MSALVDRTVVLALKDGKQGATVTVEEKYIPIVQDLEDWIFSDSDREKHFEQAVTSARAHGTRELRTVQNLDDYLDFLNDYLRWVPSEDVQGKQMLQRANALYFVLNQPSVLGYQSPVKPLDGPQSLTWLSSWMVRYHCEMGKFLDTAESFSNSTLQTFISSPNFNMEEYLVPRGGYRSFNDWFARHHKPGRRPVASVGDPSIVSSPADCRFLGAFGVDNNSRVTLKGLEWSINQLLEGSTYQDKFAGGVWMHGFLNVDDYHRIHAPVAGTVLEARVIQGQNYSAVGVHKPSNSLTLLNGAGYQFVQTRGLVVLDTGLGLVAVLPVAMIAVSSVILTAEPGAHLRKGEELGFFQFGGSDVVLVFESSLNVKVQMLFGEHYKMGQLLGEVSS